MLSLTNQFSHEFSEVIEGHTGQSVSVDKLSIGAKINKLFHERLPLNLAERKIDEKNLRREIKIVIQNIRGVRSGLFTPDMAFERIVKEQIEQMMEAPMKLVDNVTSELISAVRDTTKHMSTFPVLREEIDRVVSTHIRESDLKTKDYIKLMFNFEMSYINTNHDDFIGFTQAAANTANEVKKTQTKVENKVIRSGWLSLGNVGMMRGGSKEFWFVLTPESLSWFKDDTLDEKKYMVPLSGDLKLRSQEKKSVFGAHFSFQIFNQETRNVYKDHRTLDLSTTSADELESWKASFLRAGVYPEYIAGDDEEDVKEEEFKESNDPQLERQVETIRNLVDSYIQIVVKNLKDQVPKMIMHLMLNSARDFIAEELVAILYSECNGADLMKESQQEIERKTEMLKIYNSLKDAVKIVTDININTTGTAAPPPVDNSWIQDTAPSSRAAPPSRPSATYMTGSQQSTNGFDAFSAPPSNQNKPLTNQFDDFDPFASIRSLDQSSTNGSRLNANASPIPMVPSRPRPQAGQGGPRPPPSIPSRPGMSTGRAPPAIPNRPKK